MFLGAACAHAVACWPITRLFLLRVFERIAQFFLSDFFLRAVSSLSRRPVGWTRPFNPVAPLTTASVRAVVLVYANQRARSIDTRRGGGVALRSVSGLLSYFLSARSARRERQQRGRSLRCRLRNLPSYQGAEDACARDLLLILSISRRCSNTIKRYGHATYWQAMKSQHVDFWKHSLGGLQV